MTGQKPRREPLGFCERKSNMAVHATPGCCNVFSVMTRGIIPEPAAWIRTESEYIGVTYAVLGETTCKPHSSLASRARARWEDGDNSRAQSRWRARCICAGSARSFHRAYTALPWWINGRRWFRYRVKLIDAVTNHFPSRAYDSTTADAALAVFARASAAALSTSPLLMRVQTSDLWV